MRSRWPRPTGWSSGSRCTERLGRQGTPGKEDTAKSSSALGTPRVASRSSPPPTRAMGVPQEPTGLRLDGRRSRLLHGVPRELRLQRWPSRKRRLPSKRNLFPQKTLSIRATVNKLINWTSKIRTKGDDLIKTSSTSTRDVGACVATALFNFRTRGNKGHASMLNHTPCIHNESGHIYAYVCFLLRHIVLYVKFGLQADPEETAPEIDAHKTGIAIPILCEPFLPNKTKSDARERCRALTRHAVSYPSFKGRRGGMVEDFEHSGNG